MPLFLEPDTIQMGFRTYSAGYSFRNMLLPRFRPDGADLPYPPFEGGGFLRCLQNDGG